MFLSPHKLMSDAIQLQMQIEAAKQADSETPDATSPAEPKHTVQDLSLEELRARQSIQKLKVSAAAGRRLFAQPY